MNDSTEVIEITNQQKNLGTLSHLSGFVMFLGIPSLFGPLAVWLFNREDDHVGVSRKGSAEFQSLDDTVCVRLRTDDPSDCGHRSSTGGTDCVVCPHDCGRGPHLER